ncbi:hypothetical protein PT2222_10262 [Paraburkholderia tropica]
MNSFGGEEEDRTPDLRIANATLSQLSYPPTTKMILAQLNLLVPSVIFELTQNYFEGEPARIHATTS